MSEQNQASVNGAQPTPAAPAPTPEQQEEMRKKAISNQSLANTQAKINLTFQVLVPLLNAVNKEDLQDYVLNRPSLGNMEHPAAQFTIKFASRLIDLLDLVEQQADLLRAASGGNETEPEPETEQPEEKTVNMARVESSNILGVGYDDADSVLFVQFNDGAVYTHNGVPVTVYKELMEAKSIGGYYHANIKGRYESKKVVESGQMPQAVTLAESQAENGGANV